MLRSIRKLVLALAVSAVSLPAMAEVWDSGGIDNNWGTGLNWDTNIAPPSNGTANIVFGSGARLTPNLNAAFDVASVTFISAAPSFIQGGSTLGVHAGITNNSSNTQTFNNLVGAIGNQTWTAASGPLVFNGPVGFGGNVVTVTGSSNTSFTNVFSGTNGLTKNGSGTLTLGAGGADASINNVTGLTTILNAGTLSLDKASGNSALGGNVVMNDGTLTITRPGNIAANTNLTQNFGTINTGGQPLTLGSWTFTSGFINFNSLTLSGTATNALTMNAGFNASISNGFNFTGASGGGFAQTGAGVIALAGPINLGNLARTFQINDIPAVADDQVISGVISAGAIAKTGVGTLALLGANTYSGGTVLNAGAVRIIDDSGLGAAGSPLSLNGNTTLQTSGSFTLSHPLTTNFGTLAPDAGTTLTINTPISGSWLIKNGAGTLVLNAANTYAAYTTITSGSLALGNDQALGSSTLFFQAAGELRADGAARVIPNGVEIYQGNNPIFGGSLDLTLNGPVTFFDTNHTLTVKNHTTFAGALGPAGAGFGFTKEGNGTLVLSGVSTLTDTIKVNKGTLELAGGALNAGITNYSTFVYTSGAFGGLLTNYGDVVFNNTSFTTNGLANFASLTVPPGITVTTNGNSGMQNFGNLTLNNGILDGSADFTNNGVMNASGSMIGAKRFVNAGQLTAAGVLNIAINSPDAFLFNTGEIDTTPSGTISLLGSPLKNKGTINLNGGTISAAQPLINDIDGTITGHGNITANLGTSAGSIVVSDGALHINNAFTNSGAIQIGGIAATLSGGTITNTGTIQGFGTVANQLANSSGSLEAVGGTLILSGTGSTNTALIAAATGNKILLTKGLPINAGTISLTGGTFDNGINTISNTGQISGYGTFRSGGLTNNGSITFTGGTSTINGNVTNAAGKKVEVRYKPAIFTGAFTNNGIFKNTSAQVTFSGTYIENGQFFSDPADNFFGNVVIGPAGAWSGGIGDRFFIAGDLNNGSTAKTIWATATAELDLIGGTTHHFQSGGSDLGSDSFAGYENNFAWGKLILGAGDSLDLGGDALYVGALDLKGGLPQIASITGEANLYYDLRNPANAYLNGQSYALSGGGSITPVPEPATGLLFLLISWVPCLRTRKRGIVRAHNINCI